MIDRLPPRGPRWSWVDGAWLLLVLATLAVGAVLRVRDVSELVLFGDELHAVRTAYGQTLLECLLRYRADNSVVALNLYARMLFVGGVLDEVTLRLPMIVAGLALLATPLLLARRIGKPTALVLLALLATSPPLVYYSFVARTYAVALLLVTLAFVAWDRWFRTKERAALLAFAVCGGFAIFFHVFSTFSVAALHAASLMGIRCGRVRWREILGAAAITLGIVALLLGPGVPAMLAIDSGMTWREGTSKAGYPTRIVEVLTGFLGGTSGLFVVAALVGVVRWLRRDLVFGVVAVAVPAAQALALFVLNPDANPIAYSRWVLIPWAVVLLLVASGFVSIVEALARGLRRPVIAAVLVLAAGAVYFTRPSGGSEAGATDGALAWWLSPLPSWGAALVGAAAVLHFVAWLATRRRGDDSSGGGALTARDLATCLFAVAFGLAVLETSPVRLYARDVDTFRTHRDTIKPDVPAPPAPALYAALAEAPDVGDVILECPVPAPLAFWTPHDVYQAHHGKRLVFATIRPADPDDPERGYRNVIYLEPENVARLVATGARYLVLHLDMTAEYEFYGRRRHLSDLDVRGYRELGSLARAFLQEQCGIPVYGDEFFEVFDITRWGLEPEPPPDWVKALRGEG